MIIKQIVNSRHSEGCKCRVFVFKFLDKCEIVVSSVEVVFDGLLELFRGIVVEVRAHDVMFPMANLSI